jgi:hypothetical protein
VPKAAVASSAARVAPVAPVDIPVTAVGPGTAIRATSSAGNQAVPKKPAAKLQVQEAASAGCVAVGSLLEDTQRPAQPGAAQAGSSTAASMVGSRCQGPEQAHAFKVQPAADPAVAADVSPAATAAPTSAETSAALDTAAPVQAVVSTPQDQPSAAAIAAAEEVSAMPQDAAAEVLGAATSPCIDESTAGPAEQAASAAEGQLMVRLTAGLARMWLQLCTLCSASKPPNRQYAWGLYPACPLYIHAAAVSRSACCVLVRALTNNCIAMRPICSARPATH